jgi:hypothetical protein
MAAINYSELESIGLAGVLPALSRPAVAILSDHG